ncbi:MAG: hypothetical protein KF830_12540 [Planctomycetes bacterium]|nr:hypothetical protein [Planctomycetota bacterium]
MDPSLQPTIGVEGAGRIATATSMVGLEDGARSSVAEDSQVESHVLPDAREEIHQARFVTVMVLDHRGQAQMGCDILLCRSGQPAWWLRERSDSIVYQADPGGPIYTLPGEVIPSPQPIAAAVAAGLTDERGVCRLEVPDLCAWGTVWCRFGSRWMGRSWQAGIQEVRFVAEQTCEVSGTLVARDSTALRLPEGSMLVGQDPSTGELHAGTVDESGVFSCAVKADAPALLRLLDAGEWSVAAPTPLVRCGAGVRLVVERSERVALVDVAGAPVELAEVFVLERRAHEVMSRRIGARADGVHRVWQADSRREFADRPGLVLIRAEGCVSSSFERSADLQVRTLVRGRDPRVRVVGEGGDLLRIDIGGHGTSASPLSCLFAGRLPPGGGLECEVPAGVVVRLTMSRRGITILDREMATAEDVTVAAGDPTTGRLAVHAEGDWAVEVNVEVGGRSRGGSRAGDGVWLFADLAPGPVVVSGIPKAGHHDWREEFGMRRGIVCEVVAGAETNIDLLQPLSRRTQIVVVDAQGGQLPNAAIRDRAKSTRVTGPFGEIEGWDAWKPPLALAEVPPGLWLPLPIRGQPTAAGEVAVATVETRWLDALAPMLVRVFTGDVERDWKSITYTSARRTGRLVVHGQPDAPGVASWPMDLDGELNVEIALRGGGLVRSESVAVAGSRRYDLRVAGPATGGWCRLRLFVPPRDDGLIETVNVVVFDASDRLLQASDSECLALRTGCWTDVLTRPGRKRIVARARSDDATAVWAGNVDRELAAVQLVW